MSGSVDASAWPPEIAPHV